MHKTTVNIEEVFTPRKSTINEKMYVQRPELEKRLLRSIKSGMHTFLFGESGNGKSWLYKHVLNQNIIPYVVVNGGNVSRKKSLTQVIVDSVFSDGSTNKTSYKETKEANLSALVANATVKHEGEFEIHNDEPLLQAFKEFDKTYKNSKKIIVLDNLEAIYSNNDLMTELADIILLLDDEEYDKYDVNFLIVGTPSDVLEYFQKTKNFESVANRIEEMNKVDGLDKLQVQSLVSKGFNILGTRGKNGFLGEIGIHVFSVTMGIAQRIHEYCIELAYIINDKNNFFLACYLQDADTEWLRKGLRQSYQVIESHLNIKNKGIGRKNQVLYSIGTVSSHQFDAQKIEKILRKEFPDSIKDNMGISQILQDFSKNSPELLIKNNKTGEYSAKDPKYIMCIRLVLSKNIENKVIKKQFQLK